MTWFHCRIPRPQATVRLYCLPYAGGAASTFHAWPAALGPDVEVQAVLLPGREQRFGEDPRLDWDVLAHAIAAHADGPFALYGHSLGAIDAFEVVRRLVRTGGPLPVRLYAGACTAPHLPRRGPFAGLSRSDDEEFLRRLSAGGGVPAAVLAQPELVELLLPLLRADFLRLDDYICVPGPPLAVPIVAFAGRADTLVARDGVEAWAAHTAAGFRLSEVDGGHFFLRDTPASLMDALGADLRTTGSGVTAERGRLQ